MAELRDQRISVALDKTTKENLKKIQHTLYKPSLNTLINEIIQNYIARHKDAIEDYDAIKNSKNRG